ncbi:alkylglycerol monooxygenase-like [Tropilaelaps mercedesae]|uniref:Alkylglycerol monooxygenase-like n=1 Tax=Tropilaelaps mercedesae TaxID=418985 RepID=A0A1V9XGZ5_9ACAR|nr:alkylglycerol monooxygenase-like [Tropilaelaps mercedesae]
MDSWTNKLQCLIKGPGWEPGSPWTGYPEKVPGPEPSKEPVFRKLSWYWEIFLLCDLIASTIYFSVMLLRLMNTPTNVYYGIIILLYVHAWCVNLVLVGHVHASIMQMLRLAVWRTFLQPYAWRFLLNGASPFERFLQMCADKIAFALLLASCAHVFIKYHKSNNANWSEKKRV